MPCHYTPITAAPGKATKADITFALTPGAPILHQLGYGAFVTGLSGDGNDRGRRLQPRRTGLPLDREDRAWSPMNVAGVGGRVLDLPQRSLHLHQPVGRQRRHRPGRISLGRQERLASRQARWHCGTDTNWNMAISDDGSVFGFTYNTCSDYKAFRGNPNTSIGAVEYNSSFQHPDGTWANSANRPGVG